jgi:hypothetical protein
VDNVRRDYQEIPRNTMVGSAFRKVYLKLTLRKIEYLPSAMGVTGCTPLVKIGAGVQK